MNFNFKLVSVLSGLALVGGVAACGSNAGTSAGGSAQGFLSGATNASYVKFNLVDKPSDDATSVMINIQQVEVFASKGSDEHRIILGSNIGMVDLLTLQNGVLKALGNLLLPDGVTIEQMRFVLGDGSYLVHKDGSTCALKTPSAQQSGVKLLFTPALTTEANVMYDITLDFDVDSSIVFQGNGGCLLKPVIKVKDATATPVEPIPTPTPMPTATPTPSATPASDGGGSGAQPTPSPTPGIFDPQPTGSPTTLPTSGSSDGTFSGTTSSSDPTATGTGSFWQ